MDIEVETKRNLQKIRPRHWDSILFLSVNTDKVQLVEAIYDNGLIYPFDWIKWEEGISFIKKEQKNYEKRNLMFLIKLLTLHIRKDHFNEGWLDQMINNKTIFQIITAIKKNL